MKTYIFLFFALAFTTALFAQTDSEKKKLAGELPKRDEAAGKFNPAFFNDSKNQHQALTIEFDNGVYKPVKQTTRAGKLPFALNGDAPFVVSFIGEGGKQLGSYAIETPATVRSCEAQKAGLRSSTGKFTFEVLYPNNPAIQNISLSNEGKQIAAIRIPVKSDDRLKK